MDSTPSAPAKVLVVDDLEEARWVLSNLIQLAGFAPVAAASGAEALARIRHEAPDVVLLDVRLPDMDGFEVLARAKAHDKALPVIMVTAYGETRDAVRAIRAGAYDYVSKPFNNEDVVLTVRRALEEQAARRKAEQELKEAQERFRNILMLAADAIISVDEDQRIVIFNKGAEQIFGYRAEEVIGKPLELLLPARYAEAHRRNIEAFSRAPETVREMNKHGEIYGRRKDGTEFCAEGGISKLIQGSTTTFTVILRDITGRRRAEKALREKDELLTMVGAMAHVGGWEFDVRTGKGTWTEEVARIHDMDPKEETGVEKGLAFYQGKSREKINTAVREVMEQGKPYDLELEMVTAKGNRKWVRTVGQPVREGAAVVKVTGSFQDITDRKRAEDEIRALNATLERRVAERTAELEAANKELESFSYSVSHDLRAPLRALDGYSRMLEEDYGDKLDEEGRRLLGVVRDSSQNMGALIDDLLAFSRLGRKAITAIEVDMNALVREVLNELRPVAGESAQRCVIEPLPAAWCDRALLRQVWVNLLSNAFKFAGKREQPVIKVAGHHAGENVYSVSDNGAGFDMQYYDKLFGVFQRLHSNDEFPGTGAGLAIVRRVVTRHGGRVWAEGKVNEGATFYFALPKGAANG
ncbi:MAG: PAS domain S-box protein [Betaproteobacteria bacterium]|nr:PAS domain S-box protein [Betaproteobacteria bacterium]